MMEVVMETSVALMMMGMITTMVMVQCCMNSMHQG
jgi:hypothetical protein